MSGKTRIMEEQLLRDPASPPSEDLLRSVLKNSYQAYEEMMKVITGAGYGLEPQWNYYKDGKAWLCKVVHKKKTVFWLSVWDGFFKAGFYFVERHCPGIHELEINANIKQELKDAKPFGTLYPVTLRITGSEQIRDLLTLINYKKGLKG
jgi:hypothetical protein